ncbi:MAG: glycoside hydrolase family 26 protein [Acidimicrobiia bacterium]
MSRSMRSHRLRTALLVACLPGLVLVAPAARAEHDIEDDPAAYGMPHAGWDAPPRGTGPLAPVTGALLGVHPEDSLSGEINEENQHIITTERSLGRRLDINNSYYGGFSDIADDYEAGNPDKRGLSHVAYWDKDMGRIPLIGWGCKETTSAKVAAAKPGDELYEVIQKTAAAFKDFGAEIFVRYCWEMDGSKRISEVGDPEEFVAAWINIWNIFKAEGVTNVVWVWCGNANTFKHKNDKGHYAWDYYPGDQYVDWVSADGYNWGAARRGGDRWRGMIEIFDEFMVWARSTGAPATKVPWDDFPADGFPRKTQVKPIMIGEYGAIEDDDNHLRKAEWMRITHDVVNGDKARSESCPHCGVYSDIAAMVYFDINADGSDQNGDWRINSTQASTDAYRTSAASTGQSASATSARAGGPGAGGPFGLLDAGRRRRRVPLRRRPRPRGLRRRPGRRPGGGCGGRRRGGHPVGERLLGARHGGPGPLPRRCGALRQRRGPAPG